MNWMPWRRKPEKRQSTQPFTDAIVGAIAAQAGGSLPSDPLALGALEMAAGAYARAFAGAKITPDTPATRALTPAVRGLIGRDIIRRGESVHLIAVRGGAVRLFPASSWDVRGSWEEEQWFYRLDLFGPSGNTTQFVPSAAVLHVRHSYDPSRPWLGLGPLQWASMTGTLAANLEQRLGQEAGGPVGHVIAVPQDPEDNEDEDGEEAGALADIRRDLSAAKGRTFLVETTAAGWGEGQAAAPQSDWQARRFGASPPETLAVLRSDAGQSVLALCGVPPSLFVPNSDGTAQRESWRRFAMGSLEPVAAIVAEEIGRKLDVPSLAFSFKNLWAHDLAGRAQGFKQMVTAGMDIERAAGLSGLVAMEDE